MSSLNSGYASRRAQGAADVADAADRSDAERPPAWIDAHTVTTGIAILADASAGKRWMIQTGRRDSGLILQVGSGLSTHGCAHWGVPHPGVNSVL